MTTETVAASNEAPAAVAEQPKKPPPRTLAPIATTADGLRLTSLDDMWRLAGIVLKAGWSPKDATQESNLVAIQMGAEVGLPAMQAIQNIAVINGRPTIWGDAMLGLCQRNPIFDHAVFTEKIEGEGDNMVAVCKCARRGGQLVTSTFSVADAKVAGLWAGMGIDKDWARAKSPWVKYPKRMLQMRARGFGLRDAFADALKGLYAREELPTPDELLSQIDYSEPEPPEPPKPRAETVASKAKAVATRKPTAQAAKHIEALQARGEPEGVTTPEPAEKPVAATAAAPAADQDHDAEDRRIVLRDDILDVYNGLPDNETKVKVRKALMLGNINAIEDMKDVAGLEDLLVKITKLAEKA